MRRQPGARAAASIVASSSARPCRRWATARNPTSPTEATSVSNRSSQCRSTIGVVAALRRQHAAETTEGEVEVARSAHVLERLGVGQRAVVLAGDGPHEGAGAEPEREVVDLDLLDRRHRLVDVAELAVGQRQQDVRLVRVDAGLAVALDDLLGQGQHPFAVAEVHGHARGGLQRHPELSEGLAEGDRLLHPPLGIGLLAESRRALG